ncbi:hydroxyacylglutathione hydrolase [Cupriavidus alkaliphilus]|uniref:Hydroxyacylglutathione hydrolase n=1 Tax=Cupriavidus alkaliphilus TaxID=942866 RepID=A0A7W4V727_9BURK|nr:hydroxyacylglutathione hydrolase [Cupriavidus alkaliphilus]MBB3006245.1 hydroxyacylglutathione hydrolase [Cupriavidus alkaliphilus]
MLKVEPIPAFQDNYIWAIHDGHSAAVVDPGEAAPVERFLAQSGLALGAIVITHHHGDHQGGVAELLAAHPRAPSGEPLPVLGPAGERIGGRTRALREGDVATLDAPALTLRVLDVPGHTAGHIAYVADLGEAGPAVFCGDTLFASGCGRLFEGTPAQMLASLDKLAALPGDTRVYCAHEYTRSNVRFARAVEPGNAALEAWEQRVEALRAADQPTLPTTIAHERQVNPFLRSREPAVRAAVSAHGGTTAGDAQAFGALRGWKDNFR